jgi:hypothetical protein
VAVETVIFRAIFSKIALAGIVSALSRHCQYSYQILTKIPFFIEASGFSQWVLRFGLQIVF